MSDQRPTTGTHVVVAKAALDDLFTALREAGYTLVGPTVRQGAIVYDEVHTMADLPVGYTDEQEAGHYRLQEQGHRRVFDYVVGPDSWKKYLYPSRLTLLRARRNGDGYVYESEHETPRYAFIGARACELAAIAIHDDVFIEGAFSDPHYRARRERAFVLAVNCTHPAATCFCASMDTGPQCQTGFDLALTELETSFLLEVGSGIGAQMLDGCEWRLAGAFELSQARELLAEAETHMGRALETRDLPNLLYDNLDHPRWDEVAARCLSCTNCTMVCPTCFCSDVQDVSDLTGDNTARVRVWDSCFSPDFSHVFGGNLRPNIRARYRQWLTHKLASWIDQFGTIGCVGCGRCITWCPVGIDLTAEVAAIRTEAER